MDHRSVQSSDARRYLAKIVLTYSSRLQSPGQPMSEYQQSTHRTSPAYLVVALIFVLFGVLYKFGPLLVFFGPLAFERTISVSNSPLESIPKRLHPHFAPNASDISGDYSSKTRQCTFTYSCTPADFEALMEREKLPLADTLKDGTLQTGRQWGPGVASYRFFPHSKTATVAASAW